MIDPPAPVLTERGRRFFQPVVFQLAEANDLVRPRVLGGFKQSLPDQFLNASRAIASVKSRTIDIPFHLQTAAGRC